MRKFTDITDLTDAALDVFFAVKAGDDVTVEHLTPAERSAVCIALGVKMPREWLHNTPSKSVQRGPKFHAFDIESAILDRQDREENGDY